MAVAVGVERKDSQHHNLRSHHWYVCEGAKTTQFADVSKSMLVELRSTGGYTMAPPSIHPTGEQLAWDVEGPWMHVLADILGTSVRDVAIAALLARHWPTSARHHMVGPLAGFLCQGRVDQVVRIVRVAATIAGEPVVARLRSWLKLSADVTAIEEMNAKHFWVRMGKDDVIGREDTANGEVVFHPPVGRISGEPIPRSSSCNGGASVL
jgi:hypothetical protein